MTGHLGDRIDEPLQGLPARITAPVRFCVAKPQAGIVQDNAVGIVAVLAHAEIRRSLDAGNKKAIGREFAHAR